MDNNCRKKLCAITTISGTLEEFMIPAMRLFVQNGYDVTIICTMSSQFMEKYSSEFHCINIQMKRGLSVFDMMTKPFKFYRIFRRERYDYVQYATTNAAWYASIGAWMARVPHRVYCMWGNSFITEKGLRRRFFKLIEKIPCLMSNHISLPSKKNQLFGVAEGLYKIEHSSVVGDGGTVGVDVEAFDFGKRESYKAEVLREYPQLKGKCVFGYLGRLFREKGTNELLNAFINFDNDNCCLLIIGDFDSARGGIDNNLLAEAKEKKNIIFHGYTKEVPKYLSAIDVLVHPTYREGFSMVIQQAMAMGCAIITTNVPGPSEVIEENKSGLLVPIKDVNSLVLAMQKLYDDEQLRLSFSEEGLKRVRNLFLRERMINLTFENRKDILYGHYD